MVTRYYTRIILFLFAFFLNIMHINCDDNNMNKTEISVKEAVNFYKKKQLAIIDVRTVKEWKMTGIIPNTYLINMHNEDFTENPNFLKNVESTLEKIKNKNVAFICASGARSEIVANYFLERNFENIFHIPEGVVGKENDGWMYLGFPMETYKEDK